MDPLIEDDVDMDQPANGQHANGQQANGQQANGQQANDHQANGHQANAAGASAQPNLAMVNNNVVNNINTSNVKLPEFWPEDMELWFARVESVFRRYHITESMIKFDCVMDRLPNDTLSIIKDIVRKVDTLPDPFEQVKKRLLECHKPTVWKQVTKVIFHPELGGSLPSALMASMMANMPEGEKPGYLFLGLFLHRLPADLREHLVARDFNSPQEMATHADKLWDARNSSNSMSANMVNAVGRANSPARSRNRSPSRGHGRSATPGGRPDTGLCYFHGKFGKKAKKCVPPCTYSEQGNYLAASDN